MALFNWAQADRATLPLGEKYYCLREIFSSSGRRENQEDYGSYQKYSTYYYYLALKERIFIDK